MLVAQGNCPLVSGLQTHCSRLRMGQVMGIRLPTTDQTGF